MLTPNSSFRFVAGGAALLFFAASVFASRTSSFLRLFILSPFPCAQSCLVIWFRNVGSVVPPRRLPFLGRIWCLLAGSSPPSRFPRRYQVLCHDSWYERSDLLIELADVPSTPTDIRLASHNTPGLFTVSSLPRFGFTPAGRQPGQQLTRERQGALSRKA